MEWKININVLQMKNKCIRINLIYFNIINIIVINNKMCYNVKKVVNIFLLQWM